MANFGASQMAISNYIDKYGDATHSANVVVVMGGQTVFNGSVSVKARIKRDSSIVDVWFEGNDERKFYTGYDNRYQDFTWDGEVLTITATDKSGNPITIDVKGETV